MKETGICSINKAHRYERYGNNAEPVNSGRCCDDCNMSVVIPARLYGMQLRNAMSQLGSMTSPKKAAAAKENGKKGGRPKSV